MAFGAHHVRHAAAGLYDEGHRCHNKALAAIREQAKEAKKDGDDYGAAALEFAVGYHKAALAWLKAAPAADDRTRLRIRTSQSVAFGAIPAIRPLGRSPGRSGRVPPARRT